MPESTEPAGVPPLRWDALRETLQQCPPGQWLGLLRADQHVRWAHGLRIPVESYLDHLSCLPLPDETAIDLIYSEVLLRCECGPPPWVEEYVVRFPRFASPLRQQFELLHAVQPGQNGATSGRDSRRPFDTLYSQGESDIAVDAATADRDLPRPGEDGWPTAPPGYVLLRVLGRGGMGVVYLARQKGLERLVALKMIRGDGVANAANRERFRREARMAAQLSHPNIVQIFEVDEHEGRPYCSLEYCPGGSLAGRPPMLPSAAAEVVETLARAVEFAHVRGVIHRDLKPANILLSPLQAQDQTRENPSATASCTLPAAMVKIADFGLARRLETDGQPSWEQAIVGTPGYMAPEQAVGDVTGPPADVHGLGAILHELLTGKPPYPGTALIDTLEVFRTQEPLPPSALRPKVHRDLDTICLKCLQKEPSARYASAAELADELRRFLDGEPIHARPIGRLERAGRWCRRHPAWAAFWTVAAAALLVLTLGGIWYRAGISSANARAAASQRAEQTQHYHSLLQGVREVARIRSAGWTTPASNALRQACALDTEARDPVELRTETALILGATDLREGETVAEWISAGAIAFHPDGKRLAIGPLKAAAWAVARVVIADLEVPSRTRTLLVYADWRWSLTNGVQDGIRSLTFSPDGRWLLAGTRSGWVCRWDLDKRSFLPQCWRNGQHAIGGLAVSRDGNNLFTFPRQGGVVSRWDLSAKPCRAAEYSVGPTLHDAALCPTGKVLACCRDGGIALLNSDDLTPHSSKPPIDASRLAWSPDGRLLAVEAEGRLLIVNPETGRLTRQLREPDTLVLHEGVLESLAFSPDGGLLATCCSDEEDRKVKLWDVAGGRLLTEMTVPGRGPFCTTFSPGGRSLAVACGDKVKLFAITGGEMGRLHGIQALPLQAMGVSPDGRRLACVSEPAPGPDGRQQCAFTLWDLKKDHLESRHLFAAQTGPKLQQSAVFHSSQDRFAWCCGGGRIHLHTKARNEEQVHEIAHLRTMTAAPDGHLWTAAGAEVQSWSLPEWRPGARWVNLSTEGLSEIYSLAAGSEWTIAGGRNGAFHILHAADGKRQCSEAGPGGAISAAVLAPDESFAVLGTQDGKVSVVSVPNGERLGELPGHLDSIEALALDGTGKLLATGSRGREVRLWQRKGKSFELLLVLRGFSGPVRGLWLQPEGLRLGVLIGREGAVRVVNLEYLREECRKLAIGW